MSLISKAKIKDFEHHHAAMLIFLLIAAIFAGNIMAFSAAYNHVKLLGNSYSGLSSSQQALAQTPETIIVTQNDIPEIEDQSTDDVNKLQGLDVQLLKLLDGYEQPISIYIEDLNTNQSLGINERTTYVSASFYKLFVSYEVARQINLGFLSSSQDVGNDASGNTIEECLYKTLSYSDNPCGRALRKLIDADTAPNSALAESGFYGTSLVNDYPTTSAYDVGLFFKHIYQAKILDQESNNLLLQPLLNQEVNNRLPKGIPEGTKFAHKTADLDGYSHDGGIIYSPAGDYIIVVMSGPWDNGYSEAPEAHIKISKLVYDWFNSSSD